MTAEELESLTGKRVQLTHGQATLTGVVTRVRFAAIGQRGMPASFDLRMDNSAVRDFALDDKDLTQIKVVSL